MTESLAYLLKERSLVGNLHLLRQIADGAARRDGHSARCGVLQSGDDFEHSGLSGAVFADKGNAVAPVDHIVYVIEERFCAKFNFKILYCYHKQEMYEWLSKQKRKPPSRQAPGGQSAAAMVDDKPAAVGDDDIDSHSVRLDGDILGDELEIVSDTDLGGGCRLQEAVVVALAASDTIAALIIGDGRDHNQFDRIDVGSVVALRLLDMESPEGHVRAVVGEDVEIDSVDAGKKEMLASAPLVEKLASAELVGQGMIEEDILGKQESSRLLEAVEDTFSRKGFFSLREQTLAGFYPISDIILVHCQSK